MVLNYRLVILINIPLWIDQTAYRKYEIKTTIANVAFRDRVEEYHEHVVAGCAAMHVTALNGIIHNLQ